MTGRFPDVFLAKKCLGAFRDLSTAVLRQFAAEKILSIAVFYSLTFTTSESSAEIGVAWKS